MEPVHLPKGLIRPLAADRMLTACETCAHYGTAWEMVYNGIITPLCGVCLLYTTLWGKTGETRISDLVAAVERQSGIPFPKNEHGQLTRIVDADRIVQAVYLSSRVVELGVGLRRDRG